MRDDDTGVLFYFLFVFGSFLVFPDCLFPDDILFIALLNQSAQDLPDDVECVAIESDMSSMASSIVASKSRSVFKDKEREKVERKEAAPAPKAAKLAPTPKAPKPAPTPKAAKPAPTPKAAKPAAVAKAKPAPAPKAAIGGKGKAVAASGKLEAKKDMKEKMKDVSADLKKEKADEAVVSKKLAKREESSVFAEEEESKKRYEAPRRKKAAPIEVDCDDDESFMSSKPSMFCLFLFLFLLSSFDFFFFTRLLSLTKNSFSTQRTSPRRNSLHS